MKYEYSNENEEKFWISVAVYAVFEIESNSISIDLIGFQ